MTSTTVLTPPIDSGDTDMATTEPRNVLLFKEWFVSHGGSFHPGVRYSKSSSGFSIVASESEEAIEPDTTIVTCPFSIVITPILAKNALLPILQLQAEMERWTERQSIIVYVCFHWIASPEIYDTLIHTPYLNTLPSPSQLRTTLHFTEAELDALRGTNLYGATLDRRQSWEAEWEQRRADILAVNAEWGKEFTWERFLTASTYLSSRAFPSTLFSSSSPSLDQHQHQPDLCPVLIPGIDALNHARAQPVSWVVTSSPVSTSVSVPSISLVTHNASNPGSEIFNNYGAKPNSELLLGYGFTLPANPDDTIVLKIGGTRDAAAAATRARTHYEVGREAHGAAALWDAIMDAVKAENEEEDPEEEEGSETPEWQIILDSADMLRSMTESLLERMPSPPRQARTVPEYEAVTIKLRGDVVAMIDHYVSGQREVLQDLLQFADDREMGGVAAARQEGIVVRLEEEDDDEHQND